MGAGAVASNTDKKVIFKNCASFNNFISGITNTQVDDAHDIDVKMPMYNLIEYRKYYICNKKNLEFYDIIIEMNWL